MSHRFLPFVGSTRRMCIYCGISQVSCRYRCVNARQISSIGLRFNTKSTRRQRVQSLSTRKQWRIEQTWKSHTLLQSSLIHNFTCRLSIEHMEGFWPDKLSSCALLTCSTLTRRTRLTCSTPQCVAFDDAEQKQQAVSSTGG